jgi:hypothetical protein
MAPESEPNIGDDPPKPVPPRRWIYAFSGGLGLMLGGPAFGLVGELLGERSMWGPGIGLGVIGVLAAVVGGLGLLADKQRRGRGKRLSKG